MQPRKNKYTDEQLITMICQGAEDLYTALHYCYVNWRKDAKQILLTKGNRIADVEDIIHDSIILFSEKVRTGNYIASSSSLKSYFIGICKGRSYSKARSQQKINLTNDHPKLDRPKQVNTPDLLTEEEELKNIVRETVKFLDKKCKAILELYRLSYSYKEIAIELDLLNSNNARAKALVCRKRLKALIEKDPFLKDYFNKRNEK